MCFLGVCVQVSLQIHTQVVKLKRSCVVKSEHSPYFDHRMTFKLRSQHLDEACLRFELQQPNDVRSGERLSFIRTLSPSDQLCIHLCSALSLLFLQNLRPCWECWCWAPSCTRGACSCSTGWTWSTRHRSRWSCGTDWAGPINTQYYTCDVHTQSFTQ